MTKTASVATPVQRVSTPLPLVTRIKPVQASFQTALDDATAVNLPAGKESSISPLPATQINSASTTISAPGGKTLQPAMIFQNDMAVGIPTAEQNTAPSAVVSKPAGHAVHANADTDASPSTPTAGPEPAPIVAAQQAAPIDYRAALSRLYLLPAAPPATRHVDNPTPVAVSPEPQAGVSVSAAMPSANIVFSPARKRIESAGASGMPPAAPSAGTHVASQLSPGAVATQDNASLQATLAIKATMATGAPASKPSTDTAPADAIPIIAVAAPPDPAMTFIAAAMPAAGRLDPAAGIGGYPTQVATSQVAPALVSLATHPDGSNEMTVSLHPRDLGQVDIHLVRSGDGSTAVTITASQPGTLQELSLNIHHLHAALDAANIPVDGRTMTFAVASAAVSEQNGPNPSAGSGASLQDRGSSGQPWQQEQQSRSAATNAASGSSSEDNAPYNPSPADARVRRWQFSGLNITA